jgi:MoxR-like ATPase
VSDVEKARERIAAVREQVARVIVGQEGVVEAVVACLASGGNVLLEGVPGIGKTMLVKALAQATRLQFSRIQFTPDLMPADVVGTTVIDESDGGHRGFRFEAGPVFAHLVLADEINRATPKTQSALLEAIQEGHVTVGGQTRALPAPFCVLATQNPLEMEGTFPLPEAQLDRFMYKVLVPYPSLEELTEIVARTTGTATQSAEPVLDAEGILDLRRTLATVPVVPPVVEHALRLVLATQPESEDAPEAVRRHVRVGSSPRGAQALLRGAKFRAVAAGRDAAAFEDVRACAAPALRHRLVLSFEGEAAGITPDEILASVLESVPELPERLERESAPR